MLHLYHTRYLQLFGQRIRNVCNTSAIPSANYPSPQTPACSRICTSVFALLLPMPQRKSHKMKDHRSMSCEEEAPTRDFVGGSNDRTCTATTPTLTDWAGRAGREPNQHTIRPQEFSHHLLYYSIHRQSTHFSYRLQCRATAALQASVKLMPAR